MKKTLTLRERYLSDKRKKKIKIIIKKYKKQ